MKTVARMPRTVAHITFNLLRRCVPKTERSRAGDLSYMPDFAWMSTLGTANLHNSRNILVDTFMDQLKSPRLCCLEHRILHRLVYAGHDFWKLILVPSIAVNSRNAFKRCRIYRGYVCDCICSQPGTQFSLWFLGSTSLLFVIIAEHMMPSLITYTSHRCEHTFIVERCGVLWHLQPFVISRNDHLNYWQPSRLQVCMLSMNLSSCDVWRPSWWRKHW